MNLKDLIDFIVRSLVDTPEAVDVRETLGDNVEIIEIVVAQNDIGKVIGREGRIANALRTIAKAAAAKSGRKVTVEILSREEAAQRQTSSATA